MEHKRPWCDAAIALAMLLHVNNAAGIEPRLKAVRQAHDGGGLMRSTNGDLELSGTFGQPDVGVLTGGDLELSGGFWFAVSPSDCDENGAVDFLDHRRLGGCVTGPTDGFRIDCRCLDLDASGTVDLHDAAAFQRAFNDATPPLSTPGLTTVVGFVRAEDGSPVARAEARINDEPDRRAVTDAAGRFIILDVATTVGKIHVKALKALPGGILATGAVTGLDPCANGITDAGVITIVADGTDADRDKLPDALEPALGYDPTNPDTDGNGIIDGLEDPDGDGVVNSVEVIVGTDATDPDSDDDFLTDAEDLDFRTDPLDPDTDADGVIDGEEVEFASDPLSAASQPVVMSARFGHAVGLIAAVGQAAPPAPNVPFAVAFAPTGGALENRSAPPPLNPAVTEAAGPVLSVDNLTDP